MKHQHRSIIIALFLTILTACAPTTQQSEPAPIPPTPTSNTPAVSNNQAYIDFVTNNADGVTAYIKEACEASYPDLEVENIAVGAATTYVADQNPTTLTYQPVVEILLGDRNGTHYFVDFNDGALIVKDGNKTVVSDQNVINLVVNEAVEMVKGSRFSATITVENTASGLYIKQATCTVD